MVPYIKQQILNYNKTDSIFPHYRKRDDFRKMLLNKNVCLLIFSRTFVRNISHSKKK
jgi:hypothetical protein